MTVYQRVFILVIYFLLHPLVQVSIFYYIHNPAGPIGIWVPSLGPTIGPVAMVTIEKTSGCRALEFLTSWDFRLKKLLGSAGENLTFGDLVRWYILIYDISDLLFGGFGPQKTHRATPGDGRSVGLSEIARSWAAAGRSLWKGLDLPKFHPPRAETWL